MPQVVQDALLPPALARGPSRRSPGKVCLLPLLLSRLLSEKGVAAAAEEETRSTNGRARPGVLTVEGVGRELLEEVPRPGGAQRPVCAVVCLTCK